MLLNHIEEFRERRGLSRQALGAALRPSKSALTIWRYETGITPVTDETLYAIAEVLDVEASALLRTEAVPRLRRRHKLGGTKEPLHVS